MAKYTPLEKRRALRAAAMPEVKRLVKKFGRATIANCIAQLQVREKTVQKIAALRREAARLAKAV